jgi:hypothetical protein
VRGGTWGAVCTLYLYGRVRLLEVRGRWLLSSRSSALHASDSPIRQRERRGENVRSTHEQAYSRPQWHRHDPTQLASLSLSLSLSPLPSHLLISTASGKKAVFWSVWLSLGHSCILGGLGPTATVWMPLISRSMGSRTNVNLPHTTRAFR